MYEFQRYVKEEFVEFFKNKKFWKDELATHLRLVELKMKNYTNFKKETESSLDFLLHSLNKLSEGFSLSTSLFVQDFELRLRIQDYIDKQAEKGKSYFIDPEKSKEGKLVFSLAEFSQSSLSKYENKQGIGSG